MEGPGERGRDSEARNEACRPDETGRDEAGKFRSRPGNKRHAVERPLRGCCPISRERVLASWASNWVSRNPDCMFCLSLHCDRLSPYQEGSGSPARQIGCRARASLSRCVIFKLSTSSADGHPERNA